MMKNDNKEASSSNYGWVICFACALLLFCTGGLATTGFAAYQPYLIELGGLTNTQSSTVLMFRTMFTLIGLLTAQKLISRYEVRRVVSASCFLCALSFLMFAYAEGAVAYIAAASLAGLALGCGGMIPVSIVISRWFNEHRGLALGICMAATGFSAIVASPLITIIVERVSLRASFLIESGFVSLCAVIVYLLLHSKPSCIHARPVGNYQRDSSSAFASHNASRHLYAMMMLGILLFGIPANTLSSHISVLYQSAGFPSKSIATVVAVSGGMMTIGKCTYGQIADKLGVLRASAILYALLLIGAGLCCFAEHGSFALAVAASGLTGFGLAVTTVSISIYASRISTEAEYAHTVTRFQIASTLGALLFGPVPGMIADDAGSYVPAFEIMFLIALVSAVILLFTYKKIRKEDHAYFKMA